MNLNSFMPVKLITGAGCVRNSAKELAKLGSVCLIVSGKTAAKASGALQDVTDTLDLNGQKWLQFDGIGQNPKLTDCMAAAQKAIAAGADFILGIGGGSALDAAKCIAVLAANPGLTQAQLYAFDWANPPLKIVAVGTTAGTGSEVTKVSVITTPDGRKKSFHNEAIFPHPPASEKIKAIQAVSGMVQKYGIEVIAIGNGTASRETEEFIKRVPLPKGVRVFTVSEDGASIYSASEVAREEFPDYDVTVRGAVSIGRRLMDPLAELVKIDPKSLGVGQYQHDVDQTLLKEKLDNTVESCVNSVGVNLNTASSYLLSYVAGIGPALADNIVDYRSKNGAYTSRAQLLKVKRLGEKAFEQCAGFLRIADAENPLDNSAVHPEAYHIVDRMARDLRVTTRELVGNAELCDKIDPSRYVEGEFGLPTVNDIISELRKPGRDPRESAQEFEFSHDIHSIDDLRTGMELPGIVTNITAFGAFVDIGIKQNGLIHASQMGVKGMADPSRILKLHQKVKVTVVSVDLDRARIGLRLIK